MTHLKIDATDTLFFRDGKPFEMGDDTWANGMFPNMPPGVFAGALRADFAARTGLSREEIAAKTEDLIIHRYGLMMSDELAFPVPLDVVRHKDMYETTGLSLRENPGTSNPLPMILVSGQKMKVMDMDKYRMDTYHFNRYLNGEMTFTLGSKPSGNQLIDIDDYMTAEPKIGIGRDRSTNVAREGALYRVGMTRLQGKGKTNKISIYLQISGLEPADKGFIRLGAENKTATYNKITPLAMPEDPKEWGETGIFKVYLFTPAILKQGIVPEWLDEKYTGSINGVRLRLLTCSVGRPLPFGGFDLKEYRPKPMKKAVPAGSVYYFELQDKTDIPLQMQKVRAYFQANSFSEERGQEGLGVIFIAKYHESK
jgi:CRISPR-associated protein Cmr3